MLRWDFLSSTGNPGAFPPPQTIRDQETPAVVKYSQQVALAASFAQHTCAMPIMETCVFAAHKLQPLVSRVAASAATVCWLGWHLVLSMVSQRRRRRGAITSTTKPHNAPNPNPTLWHHATHSPRGAGTHELRLCATARRARAACRAAAAGGHVLRVGRGGRGRGRG